MSTVRSWLPVMNENKNFKEETGWNVILKQIYIVLMTPKGSRTWQPDFGSDIFKYIFEHDDQKTAIENEVRTAFKWLPHIALVKCEVTIIPLTGRSGSAAHINLLVEWNKEQLPIGMAIPTTLDSIDGTVYDIELRQITA